MTAHKTRRNRTGPTTKIANSYPQAQWERFEQICFDSIGMNGRETLKYLVASSVHSGYIPIPALPEDTDRSTDNTNDTQGETPPIHY